jgi:hypothetical protein
VLVEEFGVALGDRVEPAFYDVTKSFILVNFFLLAPAPARVEASTPKSPRA